MTATPTHTVATLHVSNQVFEEIEALLRAVGYHHVYHHVFFQEHNGELLIDMSGLALKKFLPTPTPSGTPVPL